MKQRRPRRALNTDVNVTSLVDVMMVLLIIFILVAPILSQGIDVKLPEAGSSSAEPERSLRVTLSQDGQIFFDGKSIILQRVDDEFRTRAKENPETPVVVEGDEKLAYGSVMDILDRARLGGLTRVSLATEPRSELP
jgi:biopolymer transport protein ExbD